MARNAAYCKAGWLIEAALYERASELDLSGLGLTELPAEIGQLANLQVLILRGDNPDFERKPYVQRLGLTPKWRSPHKTQNSEATELPCPQPNTFTDLRTQHRNTWNTLQANTPRLPKQPCADVRLPPIPGSIGTIATAIVEAVPV